MTPLLDVQHLTVTFERQGSQTTAVDDLNLTIEAGETLGLVGESGSGKSVTALTILRLLQPPARVRGGQILFEGRDLLSLSEAEMRSVRGGRTLIPASGRSRYSASGRASESQTKASATRCCLTRL